MSKRILVVDSSQTIQTVLALCFTNAGHRVITCRTVQEALTTLPTRSMT